MSKIYRNEFTFAFRRKTHDAVIVSKDMSTAPSFVFIHGGGEGSKERMDTFSESLAEADLSLLAFDLSGAGKDSANIKDSSLERRLEESAHAIGVHASQESLTICGSSMGGEIAVRLTEQFPVDNLILFCPAIYDEKAFPIKFGEGFTDVIRLPESWKHSRSLSILKKFTGNLLVVIGEQDEVIPPGVIASIEESSTQAKKKEVVRIPGCPHRYQEWLAEHPDEHAAVSQKVLEFSR